MFIAPYGCSWANPSPCKSLLAQCFKYRAWFKHTFLFGSLAFSIRIFGTNSKEIRLCLWAKFVLIPPEIKTAESDMRC